MNPSILLKVLRGWACSIAGIRHFLVGHGLSSVDKEDWTRCNLIGKQNVNMQIAELK